MNTHPSPEALLMGLPGNRGRELAAEIHGLQAALSCVTPGADSDQVHGRIDGQIQERRQELQALLSGVVAEGEGVDHA